MTQIKHPSALIGAGTSDVNTAIVLKRSIMVVRAKARTLGKPFRVICLR
jgi:hypothetical protein